MRGYDEPLGGISEQVKLEQISMFSCNVGMKCPECQHEMHLLPWEGQKLWRSEIASKLICLNCSLIKSGSHKFKFTQLYHPIVIDASFRPAEWRRAC
jgi:hypothetical protein